MVHRRGCVSTGERLAFPGTRVSAWGTVWASLALNPGPSAGFSRNQGQCLGHGVGEPGLEPRPFSPGCRLDAKQRGCEANVPSARMLSTRLCEHQAPHPLQQDRGNPAAGFGYVLTPAPKTLLQSEGCRIDGRLPLPACRLRGDPCRSKHRLPSFQNPRRLLTKTAEY
uniref:Uncharacterized protein n=1 Tax=Rangifer tarandus platyrhynchus TaxID=3082113 RepID=A0ACB0F6V8_RANTA|nr:unnamed protein product [Rangifer tarandus platyrhynchus]